MKMKFLTLAAALVLSSVAWAEDAAKDPGQTEPAKPETGKKADAEKKPEVKLTEVRFCPMMGHPVGGKGAGQRVYKNYRVYFC